MFLTGYSVCQLPHIPKKTLRFINFIKKNKKQQHGTAVTFHLLMFPGTHFVSYHVFLVALAFTALALQYLV